MEKRGQFTFYRSFYNSIKDLPDEVQHHVLMAVLRYALDGIPPEGLEMYENSIFLLIQPNLDSSAKKAANGRLAKGKPKAKAKQNESKGEKEKETEIEKEVETEIENELETEIEIEDEYLSIERDFQRFWNLYPVKIDKSGARKAFYALREELPAVFEGLKRWSDSRQWNQENGRFIPHPVKWLSQKHHLQNPAQLIPQGATGELGQAEIEAIEWMMKQ